MIGGWIGWVIGVGSAACIFCVGAAWDAYRRAKRDRRKRRQHPMHGSTLFGKPVVVVDTLAEAREKHDGSLIDLLADEGQEILEKEREL